MSGPGRRFDPSELRMPGEPGPSAAEMADALAIARELEAMATVDGIRPTDGFADRVMSAVANEPAPRLILRPKTASPVGWAAAFVVALRDAWGVATTGGRPIAVRAQAIGFVLLVVLAAGSLTGVAAIGAGGFLTSNPSPSVAPTATPLPSATPSAPATPAPSVSPDPSAEPPAEPTETPDRETPRATRTNRPGETAEPTETPEASDDHGAAGGGMAAGMTGPRRRSRWQRRSWWRQRQRSERGRRKRRRLDRCGRGTRRTTDETPSRAGTLAT